MMVAKSSLQEWGGKQNSLHYVLTEILDLEEGTDIFLLVQQKNIRSVDELIELVLDTNWARDVTIEDEEGFSRELRLV